MICYVVPLAMLPDLVGPRGDALKRIGEQAGVQVFLGNRDVHRGMQELVVTGHQGGVHMVGQAVQSKLHELQASVHQPSH